MIWSIEKHDQFVLNRYKIGQLKINEFLWKIVNKYNVNKLELTDFNL